MVPGINHTIETHSTASSESYINVSSVPLHKYDLEEHSHMVSIYWHLNTHYVLQLKVVISQQNCTLNTYKDQHNERSRKVGTAGHPHTDKSVVFSCYHIPQVT